MRRSIDLIMIFLDFSNIMSKRLLNNEKDRDILVHKKGRNLGFWVEIVEFYPSLSPASVAQ